MTAVRITLRALRNPGLRRVLLPFVVFSIAEWGSWIALLVWAYDLRGVGGAAAVSVVQLLPAVLAAPLGSVLGDRMHRGRALALGYVLQGVTMLATAAALVTDAPFAVVCAGGALVTCAITLTRPVHNAVVPDVSRNPEELTAGNAATTTGEAAGAFLGPLASALLIVPGGAESVFALFGVLLLVAAAPVVTLPVPREARSQAREGMLSSAVAGARELRREPAGAVLLGMVTGQYVVIGIMDILMIVLALDVLRTDQSGPGLLGSAFGVGSIVGALATVVLVGRRSLTGAIAVGLLVAGLPIVVLTQARSLLPAMLMLGVWGAGKAFFDVAGRTQLQRTVSDRVLARVFGLQEALMTAAIAAGAALAAPAVSALGIEGALLVTGLFLPVAGLLAWRVLLRLDARARPPGPHFDALREVPLFRVAPLPVVEHLSRRTVDIEVAAGDTIVRQHEPGDRFSWCCPARWRCPRTTGPRDPSAARARRSARSPCCARSPGPRRSPRWSPPGSRCSGGMTSWARWEARR
jgi:predicted MFS family arabinose efflux permease